MIPFRKKEKKGKLFDVHFSHSRHFKVVDLRPTIFKRYRISVILAAIFISVSVLGVRSFLTKAEVADFSPATCLGTWQNPHYAQGNPETPGFATSSAFTGENSAVYSSESERIFCGNFLPAEYEAKGNLTNVSIALIWSVQENGNELMPELPSSTTEASTTQIVPEEPSATDPATSTPEAATSTTSFFYRLLSPVFAQSAPDENSSENTSSSELAAPLERELTTSTPPADEHIQFPPPLEQNSTNTESLPASEENQQIDIAAPAMPSFEQSTSSPEENKNILVVKYSFDGQEWIKLDDVDPANWKNLILTLPITTWEELKKLQISIEGYAGSRYAAIAYLDGMILEAHYEILPALSAAIDSIVAPSPSVSVAPEFPVIVLPPSQQPIPVNLENSFGAGEAPQFDFDLEKLPVPTTTIPEAMPSGAGDENQVIREGEENNSESETQTPSSLRDTERSLFSLLLPRFLISHTLSFFNRVAAKFVPQKENFSAIFSFRAGDFFNFFRHANAGTSPADLKPTIENPIVARILDPNGRQTDFQPSFFVVNNQLRISVPEPKRKFLPGRYTLELLILKNNAIYFTTNIFTWGVLAVNFNKSIYTAGDRAAIGFAVLTDQGHTVCDADLAVTVASPSGAVRRFATRNGTVKQSSACGPQTVTNTPDYSVSLAADEIGIYGVSVTAEIENGSPRKLADEFEVQELPPFDVERLGPTRIYPPAIYTMTLRIKANQDFRGTIVETLPSSFSVITKIFSQKNFLSEDQMVSWAVDMRKGDMLELAYFFEAPHISPELYKLGPLYIGSWWESRKWQIAADAAGEVILLWEGTSSDVPNGWTCLNCATTDPFYGVYPRASSTYGNASTSRDTFPFTMTFNNASSGVAQAITTSANTTESLSTHTHTWANQTATMDIRPYAKNLYFISAATTSLPNGVIGMFDATSTANLPVNWTAYDPLNSSTTTTYLRGGENTTSTVGTTNRQVSIPQWNSGTASTASVSTRAPGTVATVGDAGHTHTQLATTTSLGTTSPPAIGVVFAKLSTASTIPDKLIAIFDNPSLPANWNSISTSGSAFAGNLIVGTSSFTGAAFGSATFSDSGSFTYKSGVPNTTKTRRAGTGTNLSHQTHTHQVAYTYSVASTSSLPVYRDVILGKFTQPPNSAPTVSAVVLNIGNAITLTPNVTTTITVVASTTDFEGVGDIRYATSTIYRSGAGASCAASNLNCYQLASSSCGFTDSTSTVSCSAGIYYFADATDATSSYSSNVWLADITVTDASVAAGSSSTITGVELNSLLAIDATPATTDYGIVTAGLNTGSTNQTTTVKNAGNATSTLKISGTALVFGSLSIATSSQHYATSSFTFGGAEQAVSSTLVALSGFLLTNPTSAAAVARDTFWGISIPTGSTTGTYTGTNTYTAVVSP